MTKKSKKIKVSGPLGDPVAMMLLRIGGKNIPALADTGSQRSILDAAVAKDVNAIPINKRIKLNIAGDKLEGQLMEVTMESILGGCKARVEAFVPDRPFSKGAIIGMDFLQKAKMIIHAEDGTVICPLDEIKKERKAKIKKAHNKKK